jgi:hypothetical protein
MISPLNISFQQRDRSLDSVAEAVRKHIQAAPGNHLVYCPSLAYLDQLHQRLTALGIQSFAQRTAMNESERESFLAKFTKGTGSVGLAVTRGHEPENLKRIFKESLARLKTDKVKILYLEPVPKAFFLKRGGRFFRC